MSHMPTVPDGHWFNPVAAFLGNAYLRNAFTKGTVQEVDFLVEALSLEEGDRLLDAGCGPGRHAIEFARRGIQVTGIDVSPEFLAIACAAATDLPATFEERDIRTLDAERAFDAVVCLCQGGFGLLGGAADEDVIPRFARALKPKGRLALTAFSSYFAVRHLEPTETFDAATGVNHEIATVRDDSGDERPFDLWTTCFTPRELRLLADHAGLVVDGVYGVSPGAYSRSAPSLDAPEHLLLAHVPPAL